MKDLAELLQPAPLRPVHRSDDIVQRYMADMAQPAIVGLTTPQIEMVFLEALANEFKDRGYTFEDFKRWWHGVATTGSGALPWESSSQPAMVQ